MHPREAPTSPKPKPPSNQPASGFSDQLGPGQRSTGQPQRKQNYGDSVGFDGRIEASKELQGQLRQRDSTGLVSNQSPRQKQMGQSVSDVRQGFLDSISNQKGRHIYTLTTLDKDPAQVMRRLSRA